MIAAGCLLLVILPLLGLTVGMLLGSKTAAILCGVGGFVVAVGVCFLSLYALKQAGRRDG